MHPFVARALVVLIAVVAVTVPRSAVQAETAAGVARIAYLHGSADVVRADSGDTVAAALNAPLAVGDTLITHTATQAEIELDYGTLVRVAPDTQLRVSHLATNDHRIQLAVGSLEIRVFRKRGETASVELPQAMLAPRAPGRYRATVASDGDSEAGARSGRADVSSESGSRPLVAGESLGITGTFMAPVLHDVVSYETDAFDRFSDERDDLVARERADAFLDRDLVGASDLETSGRWIDDARYGRVWSPYESAGWAPYHDGRFVWEPYYGWTWVAAEPWGWAPYHYGNWFYGNSGWCWYPGGAFAQPYAYRPAVVAFFSFGGSFGFDLGFGNIGWLPLAPYEPYYPWYGRGSHGTVVNNITNVNVTYVSAPQPSMTGNTFTIYHNVSAPGGMVALDGSDFSNGRFSHVNTVRPIALSHVTVVRGVVPIVPTTQNLAPASHPPAVTSVTATMPGGAFAHFKPLATPVRSFALERGIVRDAARIAYPTAPTITTVVRHPNTLTSQQAMPVPVRANGPSKTVIVTDGTAPRPNVAAPRVPAAAFAPPNPVIRAASPWDRFAGRGPAIDATRSASSVDAARRGYMVTAPSSDRVVRGESSGGNVRLQTLHATSVRGMTRQSLPANVEVQSPHAASVQHETHTTPRTIVEHASVRAQ